VIDFIDRRSTLSGSLETTKSARGYRWVYYHPGGAMHLGARWHRTKKAALADGIAWMQQHGL